MSEKRSSVGDNIEAGNAAWRFSGNMVETFPSHVRRSVPFYEVGHELICNLSDYFVRSDSVCYEIGVSVGELLEKLVRHHSEKPSVQWIGLDIEEDMVHKAEERMRPYPNAIVETKDVVVEDLQQSDMIVSYYCIQFIPPKVRQQVFQKIYDSLNWGGAFLLFEKVRASDARFQDIMTTLYSDYKLEQQFTPDEVVSKTRSLKGVLEPFSTEGNMGLMQRAGFKDVITVFKYLCFEGFLAIK